MSLDNASYTKELPAAAKEPVRWLGFHRGHEVGGLHAVLLIPCAHTSSHMVRKVQDSVFV